MTTPLLATRELSVNFGGLLAVHNLNLEVAMSQVHAIIGPNGAGKTTSFYMIVGLVRSNAGSIHIDELEIELRQVTQDGLVVRNEFDKFAVRRQNLEIQISEVNKKIAELELILQ